MGRNIAAIFCIIALLFLVACGSGDEQPVQETAVPTAAAKTVEPTKTVQVVAAATDMPTATAQATATAPPPTAAQESSQESMVTESIPACSDLPGDYQEYRDEFQGIAFCYPADWIVEDFAEIGGFIAVSPAGFDLTIDSIPDVLVLIYPHEMAASLVTNPVSSDDALDLAAGFFFMNVDDGESDELEPVTIVIAGQEQSSLPVHGKADGEPLSGLLMGYKNGQALAMSIAYLLVDDDTSKTAETIMNSVRTELPTVSLAGGLDPLPLNSFHEQVQTNGQPDLYYLQLQAQVPVLLVAQHAASPGSDLDVLEVQIFDPEGVMTGQFDSGWMGGDGVRCDPVTMSDCAAYVTFGYQQPEALMFKAAQEGETIIQAASMATDSGAVSYRLGAFDMRADAPTVIDLLSQTLESGEAFEYALTGLADQPLMAYVRPMGVDADSVTLSLALVDAMGQEIEERHNYTASGDPVFLYWVPRDDSQYTVRIREENGLPAAYELTILSDKSDGREVMAKTVPAYADLYDVTIAVQENGDLLVSEKFDLTRYDQEIIILQRSMPLNDLSQIDAVTVSESGHAYQESSSLQPGTYNVTTYNDRLLIQWAIAGEGAEPLSFQIDYLVKEGIEKDNAETSVSGEIKAGSTLAWEAIPSKREFAIGHGKVHVQMPTEVELHRIAAVGGQGEATVPTTGFESQGAVSDALTFTLSRDLAPDEGLEIEVIFGQAGEKVETPEQQTSGDGDQEALTFETVPQWEIGEIRHVERIKERVDYEAGQVQLEASAHTPIEIEVVERLDDGFVLRWTYGKTEFDSPEIDMDPMLEAMQKLADGIIVEYETDSFGTPINIRNWQDIAMLIGQSLEATKGLLEKEGLSPIEIQQIVDMIEPMFSTKEQIEAFAVDDIQLYHLVYGWEPLVLSSPLIYETLLPNQFGGDPFPGEGEIELLDIDPDAGKAVISWAQTLDPDASRQILMDTMIEMSEVMGTDPPTESDLPDPFSIGDFAEIVFDLDSGWNDSLDYTRKVIGGPTVREETTRFVDITN